MDSTQKSDDFNDSLDDLLGRAATVPSMAPKVPPASYNGGVPEGKLYEQPCPKCRGTGTWRAGGRFGTMSSYGSGGPCFKCKGTGKLSHKTAPEVRAKAIVSSTNRKAKKAVDAVEAFKVEYPDVWAWMDGSTFPPAVEMLEKLKKYGSLFDSSIDFARRMIAKREASKQAAVERVANAPVVDTAPIEAAFAKASSILKKPKLRMAGFTISRAKPNSPNAGALYVKTGDQYLGKIMNGKFLSVRECTSEQEAKVLEIARDPKGAAIAYGRLMGNCACCGRQLTDANSVAMGIGPVCAENFGW
jgi:hypothetical protein